MRAKTNTQHRKSGTYRKDRHGSRPEVPPGAPEPPAYLSEVALTEWHRIVGTLVSDVGLCSLDSAVLALYCQAIADVQRLTEQVAKYGEIVKNKRGEFRRNPLCISLREARETVIKTTKKLCLSPSDRTKSIPPSPDDNPDIDPELKDLLDYMN